MESLTAHAEATASTHYYLLLSLLGISSDTLSHAASHLGIAHCMSTLLRALPYHASKGRMVIPTEITARHGVSHEDVFRKGSGAKGIEDAVFEFATIANDNMITAREMFKEDSGKVARNAMPVFGAGVGDGLMTDTGPLLIFDNRYPSHHFWRGWRQLTLMLSIRRCSCEVGSCHGESGVAITGVHFRWSLRTRLIDSRKEYGELEAICIAFRNNETAGPLTVLTVLLKLLATLTTRDQPCPPYCCTRSPLLHSPQASKTSHREAHQPSPI